MKRFSFRLEKVLTLRKFKEEDAKLALGQAISILNKIENDIKETAVKKHVAMANRFTDVSDILYWEQYIKRLDKETQTLMEKAAQAQLAVEEKRELYLEAQKDLKAIEKLKEKRKNEYRKKTAIAEINEMDDITAGRLNAKY